MFSSLRYIALISVAIMVPATIMFGVYLRYAIEDDIIASIAEDNNISIASGFKDAVWSKFAASLRILPCTQEPCPKTDRLFAALRKATDRFFTDLPLLEYDLYFPNGQRILTGEQFSSDPMLDRRSELAFIAAQYGNVKSALIPDHIIAGERFFVVRSFVPIVYERNGKKQVEGIVELVYDITHLWGSNLTLINWVMVPISVSMFIIMFGIIFFSSKRAEHIIARQHEMNLDLTTAKASAEEENREKSKFLANVSHELRTPLNAIIGFSEILKDEVMGPLGNDQYRDYVRDIHNSGVHLLSLINDILDYSKANAGKLDIEMSDVDVNKVIRASMRLVTPRAKDASVNLKEEVPKEHVVLKSDPKRLKQVLLNILSNSVKFTPPDGTITLLMWKNIQENTIVIEVKDTGVGIPSKSISKVMASFGQVENQLSRRYDGTGLGLPLSKKLVELMGGRLEIRSKEGQGTTVTITLPFEQLTSTTLQ